MKCKVDSCEKDSHTRGWCAAHYKRVARTGSADESNPLSGCAQTPVQRLESKSTFIPISGCRLWFGAAVPKGYGVMFYQGKQQYAHRVSWHLVNGQIPDGLQILHRCDVPACINPKHLFLGTQKENIQDMLVKGRGNFTNRARGKDHHNYGGGYKGKNYPCKKLNQLQVEEIRTAYKPGVRQSDLAAKYGVGQAHISRIVRGESWV